MNTILMLICMFAGQNEPTPADATVSVLKTQTTTEAPAAATVTTPTVVATPAVEARSVRLAPWHVRRLNRVADRQEARDERNCRCDSGTSKVLLLKPTACDCR
jgi:hypothetical protein